MPPAATEPASSLALRALDEPETLVRSTPSPRRARRGRPLVRATGSCARSRGHGPPARTTPSSPSGRSPIRRASAHSRRAGAGSSSCAVSTWRASPPTGYCKALTRPDGTWRWGCTATRRVRSGCAAPTRRSCASPRRTRPATTPRPRSPGCAPSAWRTERRGKPGGRGSTRHGPDGACLVGPPGPCLPVVVTGIRREPSGVSGPGAALRRGPTAALTTAQGAPRARGACRLDRGARCCG